MRAVHRIHAGGVSLCVESTGRGDPVVMLHGFTGDARSMTPAASPLEAGFEVHRVELVGHGRSDAPADVMHYDMARCVEQVSSVFDALGIARAHLYGYSMGGRTALTFAAHHPERVHSLVLVGATAGLTSPQARAERVAADEALAARIEQTGLETFVDRWMALPLFASQSRLGDAALAQARAQRLECSVTGLANSLRGMGTGAMPPLHDRLSDVAMPVCLVVGDEDEKFEAIARDLAKALPDARVETVADAGHAAHLEQPARTGDVVRRFLQDVASHAHESPKLQHIGTGDET